MPRLPRIHIEGSLYYVTCQSHHSNELFKNKQDYNKYFNLLTTCKDKYQFKIFSYCFFPNKVHLLLGINPESSISEFMFNLNSSYTKYYNSRHGKKGPVLSGRFKSKWIEKETYLLPLTRYIHLISISKDCAYTSYPAFLEKSSPIPIKDEIREIISCLPSNTDYKDYVEKVTRRELKDIEQKLARNRFLGSKEFEQKVKTTLKAYKENKDNKVTAEEVEPVRSDVTSGAGGVVLQKRIPKNLLWGSVGVTVLFLIFTGYFYSRQLLWKEELEITQEEFYKKLTKFEQAQAHPVDSININGVQPNLPATVSMAGVQTKEKPTTFQYVLLEKEKKNVPDPLEGVVWEVKLGPISPEVLQGSQTDILKFKEGRFVSNILTKEGFDPSNYSVRYKDKGTIIWETMQSGHGGAIASWQGKWNGKVMKGILSQKFPGKEAKTFSFIGYMKTST